MAGNELNVRLRIESILKEKGLLDLKQRLEAAEKEVVKLNATAAASSGAFRAMGTAIKSALLPLAGFFAVGKVVSFLYQAAEGQREMERRTMALSRQIQQLGVDVPQAMERVEEFTTGLANLTGVVDDESIPALTQLIGLTGSVEGGIAGVKLAADIAASGVRDFAGAVELVASILAGRANEAARQLGINIKDVNGHAKSNVELVSEIIEKQEALAEQAAKNTEQTSKLGAAWDLFGDTIGDYVRPALDVLKSVLAAVLKGVLMTIDGITIVAHRAIQLPSRIWAGIKGDREKLKQLDQELLDVEIELAQKYIDAENKALETTRLSAEEKAALLNAARLKDLEAEQKAAEERRKLAEKEAEERRKLAEKEAEERTENEREAELALLEAKIKIAEEGSAERLALEMERLDKLMAAELAAANLTEQAKLAIVGKYALLKQDLLNKGYEDQAKRDEKAAKEKRDFDEGIRKDLARLQLELAEDAADQRAAELAAAEQDYVDDYNRALKLGGDIANVEEKYRRKRASINKKYDDAQEKVDKAAAANKVQMYATAAQMSIAALQTLFGNSKSLAIAQAIIDTFLGANRALGELGPLGPPVAALIIAAGLKNVMIIKKTNPQKEGGGGAAVPRMAGGGMVLGTSLVQVAETAAARPELIMPLRSRVTEELLAAALARAAQSPAAQSAGLGAGQSTIINIPVTVNTAVPERRALRELHRQLQRVAREDLARRAG
ncbi:MAG TPA: hypothetical protein PKK95_02590 [Vicinamibacterales bacterium]|nr:hypothetical protein [Vicinamibacterales bacterium]